MRRDDGGMKGGNMAWTDAEIRANRNYFAEKIAAMKERNAVVKAVDSDSMDFVLLDVRGREPFAMAHIPGAWCAPLADLDAVASQLPKDREIITYCWSHD